MADIYIQEEQPNYGNTDNIFTPNVDPFTKQESIFTPDVDPFSPGINKEIYSSALEDPDARGRIAQDSREYWNNIITDMKKFAVGEDEKLDFLEYFERGYGTSTLNLAMQFHSDGKLGVDYTKSFKSTYEDPGFLEMIAEQSGTILGDLVTLGIGATPGYLLRLPTVGAYGAGFVTESIRTTYLKAFERGDVDTFAEWWEIWAEEGRKAGHEAGMTLGATFGLPKILGAKGFLQNYLGQMATFHAMGYYYNDHIPSKKQATADAFMFGIFNVKRINLQKAIKEKGILEGKTVTQVLEDIKFNKQDLQTVISENGVTFKRKKDGTYDRKKPQPEIMEVTFIDETGKVSGKKDTRLSLEIEEAQAVYDNKIKRDLVEITEEGTIKGFGGDKPQRITVTEGKVEGKKTKTQKEKIFDEAMDKLQDTIVNEQLPKNNSWFQGFKKRIKEKGDEAKFGWEKFSILWRDKRQTVKSIRERFGLDSKDIDVYSRLRLNEAAGDYAGSFLTFGVRDINGKIVAPGLYTILQKYANTKKNAESLNQLLKSEGLLYRYKQGKQKLTKEQLKLHQDLVNNASTNLKQASKILQDWQRKVLEYERDSGLLSKAEFEIMTEVNKYYVPLHKVISKPESFAGKKYSDIVTHPYDKYVGGDQTVINPIETIIQNTLYKVRLARINQGNKEFFDKTYETDKSKVPEVLGKRKYTVKDIKVELEDISKAFDVSPDLLRSAGVEGFTIFKDKKGFTLAENEIAVKRDGFVDIYTVSDELASALKIENPYVTNSLLNFEIMRKQTQVLKAGVTVDPEMQLRNLFRDTVVNAIYSKNLDNLPFYTSLRGAFLYFGKEPFSFKMPSLKKPFDIFKDDPNKFLLNAKTYGLTRQTFLKFDNEYFSPEARQYFENRRFLNQIEGKDKKLALKQLYNSIGDFSESISKLGDMELTFNRLRKDNVSFEKAMEIGAFEAKDLIDFSKQGLKTQAINQTSAFYSPRILGTDKMFEAFSTRFTPTAIKAYLYITLPATINWLIHHDDPDYQQLSEYQKYMGFNWKLPGTNSFLHQPGPFETYQLFGALPQIYLESFKSGNPEQFERYKNAFFIRWAGDFFSTTTPDTYRLALELTTNYSLFYKNDIVSESQKRKYGIFEATGSTSETAKQISRILFKYEKDLSAQKIDYTIKATTGGLGRLALNISDFVLKETGVSPKLDTYSDDWIDNLSSTYVIKSFIKNNPGLSSEPVTRLWSLYNKVREFQNSYSFLESQGRVDDIKLLQEERLEDWVDFLSIKDSVDAINELRTLIPLIQQSDKLTPNERYEKLERVYQLIIGVSLDALKYREIQRKNYGLEIGKE